MNETPLRHLAWDACYNARDLGGYPTIHGRQTRWGAAVRADSLCRLTPAGQSALRDYGVNTLIDLRSPKEVADEPYSLAQNGAVSPTYLHLPLIELENPDKMGMIRTAKTTGENYCLVLEVFQERVAAVLKSIAAAPAGGVLFHCFAGKDRTGVISALLLSLAGVPGELIVADYAESDRYLGPLYQEVLDKETRTPEERQRLSRQLVTLPETMRYMLDYLEQKYAGVPGYLRSAGVTEAEMARIRDRLLEE